MNCREVILKNTLASLSKPTTLFLKLLLTLLLGVGSLHAQEKMDQKYIDSFKQAQEVLMKGDMAGGQKIILEMQKEAQAQKDSHVVLRTHIALLNIYLQAEKKADSILDLMWPLMRGRADNHDFVEYYIGRGNVARLRGLYNDQILALDSALFYALDADNPNLLGVCYFELAEAYHKIDNYESSLELGLKARDNFVETKTYFYQAYAWGLIGLNYVELSRYDSAETALNRSSQMFREFGNEDTPAFNDAIIGNMYLQQGRISEAGKQLQSAVQALFGPGAEPSNRVAYNQAYVWLAQYFEAVGNMDKARTLALRAIHLMDSSKQKDNRVEALETLLRIQLATDTLSQAYFNEFTQQQEEQFQKQNLDGIREYERKFKAEEAQRKVLELDKANQEAELKIQRTRTYIFAILAGVVLLTLLVILFVLRARYKTRKEIQELKQKALQLQINPHFFFNVLNSINDYITQNDQRAAHYYLARFAKLMRLTLESSRYDLIELGEELEMLEAYLTLEKLRNDSFDFTFDCDNSLRGCRVPPLMVQPFVENSVVHAFPRSMPYRGEIKVSASREKDFLLLEVTDNGVGMATKSPITEEDKSSLAIQILTERLATYGRNKGEIQFDQAISGETPYPGTRVSIKIPV